MSATTELTGLEMTRRLRTSLPQAFACWTRPEVLKQWFGPGNCEVREVQLDPRVGGAYRIAVSSEKFGDLAVRGVYREVDAPKKLSFTWQWEDDEDWENFESVVIVELAEVKGGVDLRLTQTAFPNEQSREGHDHGWEGGLSKLQARCSVMADMYAPGHFSWNELLVDDVGAAKDFYGKLFGWEAVPFTGGEMAYTVLKKNGSEIGGLMKTPMPGMPPHWLSYIIVESTDASAAKVTELGGKVCAPPFDIPGVGRIAVVQDTQGASFGLFQPNC